MASSVSHTVSIDQSYLDTLIRRAQFNVGDDLSSPHLHITITRDEYDILVKTAREFANLRRNLMRGGVNEDTLAVLTCDEFDSRDDVEQQPAVPASKHPSNDTTRSVPQPHQAAAPAARGVQSGRHGEDLIVQQSIKSSWADAGHLEVSSGVDDSPVDAQLQHGFDHQEKYQVSPRQQYERAAFRTILISNLPEGATHADVTDVVRGGQLLDIYLRGNDRSAHVSFLHSADARDFFEHTRRYDLYIKNKRVDIRWSERQFILPGHVASKIGNGATRNLVVRRYDPRLTEESIRDDLEHIHNLTVVRVTFRGGSCFISTNSVHNAMFARTCMMSRLKYKGSKIEWDADECAQPLEKFHPQRIPSQAAPTKRPMNPMANRFQLLNLDSDDDEDGNVPPEFQASASLDLVV